MDLKQAAHLANLRASPPKSPVREVLSSGQVRKQFGTRKSRIASGRFIYMEIPIAKIAVPHVDLDANKVLALAARGDEGTVVVDINKNAVGSTARGFHPTVIAIDGVHEVLAQKQRGKATIKAWVGVLAAKRLRILQADHQLGVEELKTMLRVLLDERHPKKKSMVTGYPETEGGSPWIDEVYPLERYFVYSFKDKKYKQKYKASLRAREVEFVGGPVEVLQKYVKAAALRGVGGMKIREAMALYGGGVPASLSEGSGPGARLLSKSKKKKKKKKMKGGGIMPQPGTTLQGFPQTAPRVSIRSKKKRMKADGGIDDLGRQGSKTTTTQKKKARGGSKSEMQVKLLTAAGAKKLCSAYLRATKGEKVGKIRTKAPPGCEHVVKRLKKTKGVTNPFAVAWWAHDRGRC